MAFIGAGIAAGAGILGGGISSLGSYFSNQVGSSMARHARNRMTRLSNTAYRRAMKDMRLAGLNPMLAYSQGGASTPGLSGYQPDNALAALGSSVSEAPSTAINAAMAKEQAKTMATARENVAADTGLKSAQVLKTAADTANVQRSTAYYEDLSAQVRQSILTDAKRAGYISSQTAGQEIQNIVDEAASHSAKARSAFEASPRGQMLYRIRKTGEAYGAGGPLGAAGGVVDSVSRFLERVPAPRHNPGAE